MNRTVLLLLVSVLVLGLTACGGSSSDSSGDSSSGESSKAAQIGPIQSVDVGPIEKDLAAKGKEIFKTRCTTCHRLDKEHIGPTLRDVTNRRDPVYVMNMILAPEEMIQKHPMGKKLFSEYGTMMTNQNLSEEQARAILEYLRQAGQQSPKASDGS